MTKVEELKAALQKAEQSEKEQRIAKELADAKLLIGTCMSTHTFKRKIKLYPSVPFSATIECVEDVRLNEYDKETIIFTVKHLYIYSDGDKNFKFSVDTYTHDNTPFSGYLNFRHKIELPVFQQLLKKAEAGIQIVLDDFREDLKVRETITMGDHDNTRIELKLLEKSNIETFNITNPKVVQALNREHHPFLFEDQLVKSKQSLNIIEKMIDGLKTSASHWGGRIYERDMATANILSEFIKNKKW